MTYQITKVPADCAHAFQVSAPLYGGVSKVVAEIRFHATGAGMGLIAIRAVHAMVESMEPIWRLTAQGARHPDTDKAEANPRRFTMEELGVFRNEQRAYLGPGPLLDPQQAEMMENRKFSASEIAGLGS